uniref:Uncharacterized protein n=1 Tax=Oryza nivara TaxID=4536 RepID=A0A0E0H1L7_ORYNI
MREEREVTESERSLRSRPRHQGRSGAGGGGDGEGEDPPEISSSVPPPFRRHATVVHGFRPSRTSHVARCRATDSAELADLTRPSLPLR